MFTDSREKQIVREKLWLPVFQKVTKNAGTDQIRYLCLPGADCIELKYLSGKSVLDTVNTVAVERKDTDSALIEVHLAGRGRVYTGDFENLIRRTQAFIDEFGAPFAIINLDCYGSANPLGNLPATSNMDVVRRIVELQNQNSAKSFNLLLTFKADDSIKGYSSLIRQFKPHLSNCPALEVHIQKNRTFKKVVKTMALEILQVIAIGYDSDYKTRLVDTPMTYVGKPHTTRMVSYSFELVKMKADKTQFKFKAKKDEYKSMDDSLSKIMRARFIRSGGD